MMAELEINIERKEDCVALIDLEGFLDAHTFEQLDEIIQELFDSGATRLVINLEHIEYISSAGVGVFIGALAYAQEIGGNIVLVNPAENVQEVFDLLGLSQIFTILASISDAMRLLVE